MADDVRTRLLVRGADALGDAELLAVLLGGSGAAELGGTLFSRFGGLVALLDAPAATLLSTPGMGLGRVAVLKSALPLAERYVRAPLEDGLAVEDARVAGRFLQARIGGRQREVFAALFLNARHRLLHYEELFSGSVDRACVYPRVVLRQALACNAAALVLAHNHPSGNLEPSASDIGLTSRLKRLLAEVDVRLLDHLVVGRQRVVSLAERGLI